MESDPVQTQLVVYHDANGDSCEAIERATLTYDLTPLEQAYEQSYPRGQRSDGDLERERRAGGRGLGDPHVLRGATAR